MERSHSHNLDIEYDSYQVSKQRNLINTKIDKYIVQGFIGSGAYGSVYRGIDDNTKQLVAIKVIDLKEIQNDPNARVKQIRRRLSKTQSQLMFKCNHDNVLKCYQVYQNRDLKIMVIQYCNQGTLENQINKKKKIPQDQAILILKQIINGLGEIHKQNIIHRDLKAQNILKHNGIYKIADFGFSKIIQAEMSVKQTTLGTIVTMAPQIMKRLPYGLKADIWSIGVIFYQMLTGKLPYQAMAATNMYQQIYKKNLFNGDQLVDKQVKLSPKVVQFLKKLLQKNPDQRLSWRQLIQHPIFEQYNIKLTNNFIPNQTINKQSINKNLQKQLRNFDLETQQFFKNIDQKRQIESSQTPKKQPKMVKISKDQVRQKKQQIDGSQKQDYLWAKQTHLQCLKSQLILDQIITPLENNKALNLNRFQIQFFYLLSSRCFSNLSPINDRIKKRNNQTLNNLKNNVACLYQRVKFKWVTYSDMLTQKQGQFMNIVTDKFSKFFKNQSFHQKDHFLTGLQIIDYSKEQQITFTTTNYILEIFKYIHGDANQRAVKRAIKLLKKYLQINSIRLVDIENITFENKVNQLIGS